MSHRSASEITLSRSLTLLDVTMIGMGAMIGAGIFVLTGIAAGKAGPALVLAFMLNGVVTTFTALSYAELGSSFPQAGGGYVWVKEGMGGTQGFLAGWMSWFASSVACSLYALGFGRFALELWTLAGLPTIELSETAPIDGEALMVLIFMVFIVSLFSYINFRAMTGCRALSTRWTVRIASRRCSGGESFSKKLEKSVRVTRRIVRETILHMLEKS